MRTLAFLLVAALGLNAQDLGKLPDWAAKAAREAAAEAPPADADAWVLLDRTEIGYTGDGETRQHRFRLVKVLGDGGIGERFFRLQGLGGTANRVKKLKGWNLRPDGTVRTLDSDQVLTINDASDADFSTLTLTQAALEGVGKGSYVAFESLEVVKIPSGPAELVRMMEYYPVRRWELDVARKEGLFTNLKDVVLKVEPVQFQPWILHSAPLGAQGLQVSGIPALPRREGGHPDLFDILPYVRVRFLDPATPLARMWADWNQVAAWQAGLFAVAEADAQPLDLQGRTGLEGLRALWSWSANNLAYKAVYLTPDRGWVPEGAAQTGRKRYGDCKDLSAFFLAQASRLGFKGYPVLARINEGHIPPDPVPSLGVTNHVISALLLPASLGLPAEVATDRGRFLLVDPTDPLVPLGQLGSQHRGRRVLICLPDGGRWVEIPEAAIQPDAIAEDLEAKVEGSALTGTLRLKETGKYWALRSRAHRGGSEAVRSYLTDRLDLPADAQVKVARMGDPLDLAHPFEVDLTIHHPKGFLNHGAEGSLVNLGLPSTPALIQHAGERRVYPVEFQGWGNLTFHAVIHLPVRVAPILPAKAAKNAFRDLQWSAKATPEEKGTLLALDLDQSLHPATFGFDRAEEGLKAWKQDRSLVLNLREDGLAVKMLP